MNVGELIIQSGALGVLGFIVVWLTKAFNGTLRENTSSIATHTTSIDRLCEAVDANTEATREQTVAVIDALTGRPPLKVRRGGQR